MRIVRTRWGFTALALAALGMAMIPAAALGAPPPGTPPPSPPGKPADSGPVVVRSEKNDVSPPLRDIRPAGAPAGAEAPPLGRPPVAAAPAGPLAPAAGNDPVLQTAPPLGPMPSLIADFDGISDAGQFTLIGSHVYPPDTNGDVGPNHYVQIVNLTFAVYPKISPWTPILGPLPNNTLWAGFGGLCETTNKGDPIVLYDAQADRWFLTQFAFTSSSTGPFYQCIAVSQSGDPTGAWYRYSFLWSNSKFNDYGKFGVWPDGYYGHFNQFCTSGFCGSGVVVYDRERMRQGLPATAISFDLAGTNPNDISMLPSHLNGPPPPTGTPNYFLGIDYTTNTALRIFEFHADWANPANSTFGSGASHAPNATVAIAALDNSVAGVPQPGPGSPPNLDALADRLMFRLQYRYFGGYSTLVVNKTVDANGANHAGIRWWELRNTGGAWSKQQEGTYSPDTTDHRWMGSIAMDKDGNIALGYSVSNGTATYPGIRYAGRLAADTADTLPQGETNIVVGSGSQTGSAARWGDYSSMSVDPSDGCTFWYTTEYYAVTGSVNWRTRISSFKFPSCTPLASNPAPTLSSPLVPATATAGDGPLTLTVNGTNFVYNSIVRFNGSDRATTYVSSTQLTANITAADLASAGTPPVTVFNPAPGGGTSSGATFTINAFSSNPAPTITKITPSSAIAGATAFDLIVDGTNFVAASTVRWNGATRTTSVLSSTRLSAQISAADVAAAGSAAVTVNNPTPGGGTSDSLPFGISVSNDNIANATVLASSPISLIQSTVGFTTEAGDPNLPGPPSACASTSRLQQSASAWFQVSPSTSGTLALDTLGSSYDTVLAVYSATGSPGTLTSIACNDDNGGGGLWSLLPAVALTAGTHYYIEAMAYGSTSGGTLFLNGSYTGSLANPVPTTTPPLSPASIAAGSPGFVLTVNGTNFVSGSVVRWNGSDRATAYVSPTQLAASIPAADIAAGPATVTVTVFNPAPGGGTSGGQTFTINLQAKVGFTQQPSHGVTGVALATQPWVAVQDISGNTVTGDNSTPVTISLTTLSGSGTLACSAPGTTRTVASGVAQYTGCAVTGTGTFRLHAISGTLTAADSNTFTITGPATKVAFTQQPANGITNIAFALQPVVAIQDASNNTVVSDSTSTVTLAKLSGPGALSCTTSLSRTVVNGVATFSGCTVDLAGTYVIRASSGALTTADTSSIVVTGPATKLAFTQQPSGGFASTAFPTQPIVAVQDATGATVVADSATVVTIALTGPAATLACTAGLTKTVVNGLATFAGCNVNAPNTGYGLNATSVPVLTGASSATFTVTGPANKLAFVQQPGSSATDTPFATQPVVAIQDSGGRTITLDSSTVVTLSLTGTGTLSCTGSLSRTASAGIATFSGCSVDAAGSDVIRAQSNPIYTLVDTSSFNVAASYGTVWYFAEGFTGNGWETYLYLLNATTASANVSITYFKAAGGPVVKSIVIPPQSRRTMFANNTAEGPGNDAAFGVTITSDQPITAQESLIDTAGLLAHGTVGSQVLSTQWYFAEGFTGNGWLTFISATNPGSIPANVSLTYHLTDGTSVTRSTTVPAQARFTFAGHEVATGVGLDKAFSISISSDQPIVSQEVLIDTVGLLAHGTIGVTSTGTTWYFAEGWTGDSWLTFISIGNLTAGPATVTATYNILGAPSVQHTIVVPPGARDTFAGHIDVPNSAFGLTVTSDVPIVAQEVLIDPKPLVALAHAVMGSPSLASRFTFGGGTSEAGWLTFISATNPGSSPVTVSATYYFEGGRAPITKTQPLAANSRITFASFDATGPGAGITERYGVTVTASAAIISQEVVIDVVRYLAFSAAGTPVP